MAEQFKDNASLLIFEIKILSKYLIDIRNVTAYISCFTTQYKYNFLFCVHKRNNDDRFYEQRQINAAIKERVKKNDAIYIYI